MVLRFLAAAKLRDFSQTLSLIISQSRVGFIDSSFLYVCLCDRLLYRFIRPMYSALDRSDVLSFQNPGPRGLECKVIFNVIMEWSVLKPGRITAVLILPKKLWLTKKKI